VALAVSPLDCWPGPLAAFSRGGLCLVRPLSPCPAPLRLPVPRRRAGGGGGLACRKLPAETRRHVQSHRIDGRRWCGGGGGRQAGKPPVGYPVRERRAGVFALQGAQRERRVQRSTRQRPLERERRGGAQCFTHRNSLREKLSFGDSHSESHSESQRRSFVLAAALRCGAASSRPRKGDDAAAAGREMEAEHGDAAPRLSAVACSWLLLGAREARHALGTRWFLS